MLLQTPALTTTTTFCSTRLFQSSSSSSSSSSSPVSAQAQKEALAGKEFQLEEREDQDVELTELWLNADGSVTVGQTDGPAVQSATGSWTILETTVNPADQPFRLVLERTYAAGAAHTRAKQVGEFTYTVAREYWGSFVRTFDTAAGSVQEIEGIIRDRENVDRELGYFALIDSEAADDGVRGENK